MDNRTKNGQTLSNEPQQQAQTFNRQSTKASANLFLMIWFYHIAL